MAHAGSRLKPTEGPERHRLESQPSSRTGENPPYGMIGRIEETSASYEARSAPRSYPTPISGLRKHGATVTPIARCRRCRPDEESRCPQLLRLMQLQQQST